MTKSSPGPKTPTLLKDGGIPRALITKSNLGLLFGNLWVGGSSDFTWKRLSESDLIGEASCKKVKSVEMEVDITNVSLEAIQAEAGSFQPRRDP